jgi:LCP family protein required for cell wall assembly
MPEAPGSFAAAFAPPGMPSPRARVDRSMSGRRRAILRLLGLTTLLVLVMLAGAARWWIDAGEPDARRVFARGVRAVVGVPAAPDGAADAALPPVSPGARTQDDGAPTSGPTTPRPRVTKRRGLSFVMLLGIDATRSRLTGRTDSIVILAFRERDGRVAAFSVPRDLWIEIPNRGPARINAVVRIGDLERDGGGIELMREIVEAELGIRIDRHAAVTADAFVELIDRLGGVEIDVDCPLRDCFWLDGPDAPCRMLDVPPGPQIMDGETALLYARSRHGRGDADRNRRQQQLLLALARRVKGAGVGELPELWAAVAPHVRTDLDLEAALYYASYALETPVTSIAGFSLRYPIVRKHVTEENKHVLLLDRDRFDEALAGAFDAPLPGLRAKKACPDVDAALQSRPRAPHRANSRSPAPVF